MQTSFGYDKIVKTNAKGQFNKEKKTHTRNRRSKRMSKESMYYENSCW